MTQSVRQTINGVQTVYLLDLSNPTGYAQVLEEKELIDGELVVVKTFTIGHDVLAQATINEILYLISDGHGSTRAVYELVANAFAGILQRYAYDAYGNLLAGANLTNVLAAALTQHLYSGEQTDLTGLQYLRARYYSPASGQFSRLDPFFGNLDDPLSLHKYAYVHGDPVNGTDPSGLAVQMLRASMIWAFLSGPRPDTGFVTAAGNVLRGGLGLVPVAGSALDAWEAYKAGSSSAIVHALLAVGDITGFGWAGKLLFAGGAPFIAVGAVWASRAWDGMRAAGRVLGRVAYGSSDLSQLAVGLRRQYGEYGRNLAVFEYIDSSGDLKQIATFSERGVGHSERLLDKDLTAMGIQPNQVTRIYSDLEPCEVAGGYCKKLISEKYSQAEISWAFEYGDDASRARGRAEFQQAMLDLKAGTRQ